MTSIIFNFSFLTAWLVAQYLSYRRIFYTDTVPQYSIRTFMFVILLACFVAPIIEESLFRCTYHVFLGDLFTDRFYFNLVNALLFGLVHLSNYAFVKDIKITVYQSFLTVFLGWYLVSLNSLGNAIIMHTVYNFIGVTMAAIMTCIRDKYYPNKNLLNFDNKLYISYNGLRRTKSLSNLAGYRSAGKYKVIDIGDIREDIKASIEAFNKKINR